MKTQQRIAMLGTAYDTKGGISSVVNVYRAAGLFERWPIEYIATHRDGSKLAKLRQALLATTQLMALLVRGRVALLHVHTSSGPSFWRKCGYFALARLFGVRWILHLHGGNFDQFYADSSPHKRRLIRAVFCQSAGIIALSDEWQRWIEKDLGARNVRVVFNPVTIPAPTPDTMREDGTLLFLGQFGQRKGIYVLLAAIAQLVGEFPHLKLRAGGDGELEQVRATARQLGIEEHIDILGWVRGEAKEALLARAAIYVLPSYAENLPMSVLEAMAAGLPIVSTPVGGIPSAIRDGIEGRLTPAGEVEQLATALRELLADPERCCRMGEAARQTAIEKFSAERIVAELGTVYRQFSIQPLATASRQTSP